MRNLRGLRCLLTRLARKPDAAEKVALRLHAIGMLLLACSAATHGQRPVRMGRQRKPTLTCEHVPNLNLVCYPRYRWRGDCRPD